MKWRSTGLSARLSRSYKRFGRCRRGILGKAIAWLCRKLRVRFGPVINRFRDRTPPWHESRGRYRNRAVEFSAALAGTSGLLGVRARRYHPRTSHGGLSERTRFALVGDSERPSIVAARLSGGRLALWIFPPADPGIVQRVDSRRAHSG